MHLSFACICTVYYIPIQILKKQEFVNIHWSSDIYRQHGKVPFGNIHLLKNSVNKSFLWFKIKTKKHRTKFCHNVNTAKDNV